MRRRVRQPSDAAGAFPCSRCPCGQYARGYRVGGKLRGNGGNHIPCRHGTCWAVFAGGLAFRQLTEWRRACQQALCCHGRWHLSAAWPAEYRAGLSQDAVSSPACRDPLDLGPWQTPLFAGIDDKSTQTRLKSSLLAPRRRRSNSSCNLSQTPASCQSRSSRQQVMPEPQPSSGGKSSHAMPVRSTNRIPLSAARSEMRGRPPRGFGAGAGRSFSIIGHRPLLELNATRTPSRERARLIARSVSALESRPRSTFEIVPPDRPAAVARAPWSRPAIIRAAAYVPPRASVSDKLKYVICLRETIPHQWVEEAIAEVRGKVRAN